MFWNDYPLHFYTIACTFYSTSATTTQFLRKKDLKTLPTCGMCYAREVSSPIDKLSASQNFSHTQASLITLSDCTVPQVTAEVDAITTSCLHVHSLCLIGIQS